MHSNILDVLILTAYTYIIYKIFKKYGTSVTYIILSCHVGIFKHSIICCFTQLLRTLFIIILSFENRCK